MTVIIFTERYDVLRFVTGKEFMIDLTKHPSYVLNGSGN